MKTSFDPSKLWNAQDAEWRSPMEVAGFWRDAERVSPEALRSETRGDFWGVLDDLKITLLITREYEHLFLALGARRETTYWPVPHPSGLAVDRKRGAVHLASTRNPNQVFELRASKDGPLVPVRSHYYPGRLYLHDLAFIAGKLHANSVGQNAIVRLEKDGAFRPVWWPKAVDAARGPRFEKNFLQLNSIAAGPTLASSYFSASAEVIGARRPGHRNFPVKGRGVIFSGRSREPIARGLTRPHSARLHSGRLWVDNSGFGELGSVDPRGGRFEALLRLPGWTRGLCFCGDVAFVGTSRVLPRFTQYAPGLDPARSRCGVHAVDWKKGRILGSLYWPAGNQIFAIEWMKRSATSGLPFSARRRSKNREKDFFYAFGLKNP